MNWWQALILGLVQGLTEFLPVSSSGHLVIFRELLGAEAPQDLIFEITVHVATALAINKGLTLALFFLHISFILYQKGAGRRGPRLRL